MTRSWCQQAGPQARSQQPWTANRDVTSGTDKLPAPKRDMFRSDGAGPGRDSAERIRSLSIRSNRKAVRKFICGRIPFRIPASTPDRAPNEERLGASNDERTAPLGASSAAHTGIFQPQAQGFAKGEAARAARGGTATGPRFSPPGKSAAGSWGRAGRGEPGPGTGRVGT